MSPLNVLLVEDNRLLRWCLACALKRGGYTVIAVESADEALRLNGDLRADILVTDWRLNGGENGFEVLRQIRSKFPGIVSILISAEADADLATRAREAGFQYVIEKPCQVADIVCAVNALTRNEAGTPAGCPCEGEMP
jgi:two-component system nitrogen regulation response regulator GlnG